jgi:hypothetical protein
MTRPDWKAVDAAAMNVVDPRLSFLHRAHARLILIEAGEMDLDEAYEGLVANLWCSCVRETVQRWERDFPHKKISKEAR